MMWHLASELRTIRYQSHILKNVRCCLAFVQLRDDYLAMKLLAKMK